MMCKNCNHEVVRFHLIGISGWTHRHGVTRDDTIHECKCGCREPEPSLIKTLRKWIGVMIHSS